MKIYTMTILLLIIFTLTKADQISKKYYFSEKNIKMDNSKIIPKMQNLELKNCVLAGQVGEPALPYKAISLLLPVGEEAKGIKIIKTDKITLSGKWNIAPKQYSKPLSEKSSAKIMKDIVLYNSTTSFPKEDHGNLSTSYLNGYAFALSTFTPFEYNPKEGKLSIYRNIEIQIETTKSAKSINSVKNLNSSRVILNRVKLLSQNYEMINSYPKKESSSGKILIITSNKFSENFSELKNFYDARGLNTEIATTENIYTTIQGIDNQEKIRNYIIQKYQSDGILYVLLGGDIEIIPQRGFYCLVNSSSDYEDSTIPADLYYSALDGSWNDNNDDKWAEIGEDDLLPDISIARFSFSNQEELQNMITKSITYQSSPVVDELRKPLLVGENLWIGPDTYGADYLELLIGYHEDNNYTTNGIPISQNIQKMYDKTLETEWTSSDLMNKVNEGIIFLNHVGHSNSLNTMKFYIDDITSENFAQADGINHSFPVLYSHGCICGAFDEDDCIAEKMVSIDKFASAFVCNSRYGWFNEGQTEGPSQHLNREFINALYKLRKGRIGETHLISKIKTSVWVNALGQYEEGALRWCFYDCNVLGDPAMQLWTDTPTSISIIYDNIVTNTNNYEVLITDESNNPLSDIDCSVIMNNNIIGYALTNEEGKATIEFYNSQIGDATLAISGYNTLLSTYDITMQALGIDNPNISNSTTNLYSNYPNPFNPTTTIPFNLAKDSKVSLVVFNSNGEEVVNLMDKKLNKGFYEFNFNAKTLNSGIYYYTLKTENIAISKKMILIK